MRSVAAAASVPRAVLTLDAAWDRFVAARLDTSEGTRRNYRKAKDRFSSLIGARGVHELSVADVQTAVGALTEELEPNTIVKYVNTLRQVLDFAEVEPNVARDRRVKLPRVVRDEPEPPDADAVVAMLSKLTRRWLLAFVTTEQTGMRVGEIASLCWRDVDVAGSRFRLRSRETKSRRAKWVPLPAWLMKELAASCPLEDRLPDRRVFQRVDEDGLRNAMIRACRQAGIVVYSPHDLRHRRISLWHHQGVPLRVIQERVGHARASMTLDTYSHVMPLAEVPKWAFLAALRSAGEVPVRSRA
jgi:integrase